MPDYYMTITASDDNEQKTQVRLVRAKNQAAAIRHVTFSHITCDKATNDQLMLCGKNRIELETAADE